jgi:hypothetical protein
MIFMVQLWFLINKVFNWALIKCVLCISEMAALLQGILAY